MVKKIALVLAVLAVIGGVVAGIAFYNANNNYGLLTARVIGHDFVATPETRLRIAVNTIQLGNDLYPYLPENLPIPSWIPWDLPTLIPTVFPREIAVLGGSDYRDSAFNLTVFINEQKGGPMLPQYLNKQMRVLQSIPAVEWEGEGFQLEERGLLAAEGHIPLPLGLEDIILETWSLDAPEALLTLNGGHMAEGVIDNRNGEIMTLIGGLAPIWDRSLESLQDDPNLQLLFTMLPNIRDIRMAADFTNLDTILIQTHINVDESVGGQLEFFLPMGIMGIAPRVKAQYGIAMTQESIWNRDEEIFECNVTLTGVEEKLRTQFKQIAPVAPVAQ